MTVNTIYLIKKILYYKLPPRDVSENSLQRTLFRNRGLYNGRLGFQQKTIDEI